MAHTYENTIHVITSYFEGPVVSCNRMSQDCTPHTCGVVLAATVRRAAHHKAPLASASSLQSLHRTRALISAGWIRDIIVLLLCFIRRENPLSSQ